MPVLTAIDVLGVQRFVFLSNRLRDVVTGSYLVHWSTAADGALSGLVAQGKILLAGGGNAIVQSDSIANARSFASRYARLLHDEAPGLDVVIVHKEYPAGDLAQSLQDIQIELARTKTERVPSVPLRGLSVTASCRETGLPATGFDPVDPTAPLSKEILSRRKNREEANRHWVAYLDNKAELAFPMELDLLGRSMGDTSLIGVVHVDGNGVGSKIKQRLKKKSDDGVDDDTVRREYQEWSKAIDALGKEAFRAVVRRVCQRLEQTVVNGTETMKVTGTPADLAFALKKVNGRWMLPLRPILLGGDDLTFVCDGRISLDLAETALRVFDQSDIPHLGKLTACAGVALVRIHTPFARAYELAEALCSSAKWKLKQQEQKEGCALDWHIGLSRPVETVEDIRKRQYQAANWSLTCRPYRLGSGENDPETWTWLSRTLLDDESDGLRGGVWSRRRNKVKALAGLVREGPKGVGVALGAWKVVDKALRLPKPIEADGFFATKRSPLLDAVELLDVHLVLA